MRDTDEEKRGVKGGDPLSVLTLCQSNTKVTPGGGDEAKGRLGQRGEKVRKRKTLRLLPLFAALSACSFPSPVILPCRPPPY